MEEDDDGNRGRDRIVSLPTLQNLMRKDPEAYLPEFEQQWAHFESMMEIFKLRPQKPHNEFSQQVMFLAHVAPSFPGKATALPGILISALNDHCEVMHPALRQVLVQALVLLRNRDQFPCFKTLPTYFKLFALQDKNLRTVIFTHIIRDIVQMHNYSKNQKTTAELRDFFFERMRNGEIEVSRRACAMFISLYRQNVWRDAVVVNLMSSGLLHPDLKVSAALAHLFLGNKTKGLEGILEDSDGEDAEDAKEVVTKIVGAKKTKNREKRVARAKKTAEKLQKKRRKKDLQDGVVSYIAVDLLNDPHTLADRLLQRVSKGGEPYLFRLLILHLVARLVGRHELQLLNLYPFLVKYLLPTQHEVTKVLAILVEACHALVPPDELRPVVQHVIRNFVTESQAPAVIEVGLNGIREVCSRAVNILTEDELADLVGFRKFKHKGVSMAAKSLINAYREAHPELLHRSLRGREATMALTRGELQAPAFGSTLASDKIEGIELLAEKEAKVARKEAGEKGSGDAASIQAKGAQEIMTDRVLSPEEFKQLRKMRLQRSIELQMGRKRKLEEISSSSGSGSDDDSEAESGGSDDERGLTGRLRDGVSADQLRATPKKGRSKAERLATVKAGRTDFKQRAIESRQNRRGGKTNNEQKRNKPLMMAMQSKDVRRKQTMTAKQKVKSLKKHIGTLKKQVNHQKRRR